MSELEALTNTGAAIIYFWKPIQLQFRRSMREQPDVHAQLMSEYPQGLHHDLLGSLKDQPNAYIFLLNLVPGWYYACIFGELTLRTARATFEPDTLSYHFCFRVHLYHGLANANANMGAVDCHSHWSGSTFIPPSPIVDTDALLAQLLFT